MDKQLESRIVEIIGKPSESYMKRMEYVISTMFFTKCSDCDEKCELYTSGDQIPNGCQYKDKW